MRALLFSLTLLLVGGAASASPACDWGTACVAEGGTLSGAPPTGGGHRLRLYSANGQYAVFGGEWDLAGNPMPGGFVLGDSTFVCDPLRFNVYDGGPFECAWLSTTDTPTLWDTPQDPPGTAASPVEDKQVAIWIAAMAGVLCFGVGYLAGHQR